LDYFHARMYQPRTGRFNAVDPVFAGLFDPQQWNRYAYVRNAPLVLTDPSGMVTYCPPEYQSCDPHADDPSGGPIYTPPVIFLPRPSPGRPPPPVQPGPITPDEPRCGTRSGDCGTAQEPEREPDRPADAEVRRRPIKSLFIFFLNACLLH